VQLIPSMLHDKQAVGSRIPIQPYHVA
jgi:hypothetical protein